MPVKLTPYGAGFASNPSGVMHNTGSGPGLAQIDLSRGRYSFRPLSLLAGAARSPRAIEQRNGDLSPDVIVGCAGELNLDPLIACRRIENPHALDRADPPWRTHDDDVGSSAAAFDGEMQRRWFGLDANH